MDYREDMQQEIALSMWLGNTPQSAWRDACDAYRRNYKWGRQLHRDTFIFGHIPVSAASYCPEENMIKRLQYDQIVDTIGRLHARRLLSDNQYDVLCMHYVECIEPRVIADRLSITVNNYRRLRHRALKKVRKYLGVNPA